MSRRLTWILAACCAIAQQPSPVFRVTVDLVQVDAIVTSADGRQVSGLQPDDFQLLQDGKPQKIAYFSYVETGSSPVPAAPAKAVTPMLPAIPLRPEDTRRVIALVVDDLGITPKDFSVVRKALDAFVDRQMQPGDLVAILQTGRAGSLVAHQFTNDKRALHAAIQGLQPNAASRATLPFEPRLQGVDSSGLRAWRDREEANRAREESLAVASLGAVTNIVQGVSRLPGRKSIVLFSEGFPVNRPSQILKPPSEIGLPPIPSSRTRPSPSGPENPAVVEAAGNVQLTERTGARKALNRLTTLANQAGVVLYAIDPSLGAAPAPGLDVSDQAEQVRRPDQLQQDRELDQSNRAENHAGSETMAHATGGLAINPTDLNQGLDRVLNDQMGFYLLAYKPEAGTFADDPVRVVQHAIEVRVRPRGLTVRFRSGFAGVPDRTSPIPKTPEDELNEALLSPFNAGGIGVRVTPLFRKSGALVVQSLVHVEARDVQFQESVNGRRTAAIDVALATLSEDGTPSGKVTRRFDIDLSHAEYQRALTEGIDLNLAHAVKPGAYQWRAAVRDAANGRTGSARQFVEVPDLDNGRLAMSGILMHEAGDASDPRRGPAVRQFLQGRAVDYEYEVFNPHTDDSGRTGLSAQAKVFRDGLEVWSGAPEPLAMTIAGGRIVPEALTVPGLYALALTVTDRLAPGSKNTATQSIDFELVPAEPPAEVTALPAPTPETPAEMPAAPDPLLTRLRQRAADSIRRRPNYTCVETVDRHKRNDGCSKCESSDRLRLEVAVVGGHERFAWPGTNHFQDEELNQMVQIGMVGSGDFAGASDFVFFSDLTRYKLHGEETHRGRRAVRYDYTVPVEAQAYRIRGQGAEATVGFHGSFLVDAEALDLMRLEAYADRIPEALKVTSSSMAVDFERIRIGASDFLLPSVTELRMTLASGEESVNTTRFSSCRHFEAESKLVPDAAPVTAAAGPAKPLVIPTGLIIDTRLLTSISPDVAAVGDPVQASVDHPVTDHGKVLIPKGAILNGRIKHLSGHRSPPGSTGSHRWQTEGYSFSSNIAAPDFSILVLEFNSVTVAGTSTPLHLTLERLGGGLRAADGRTLTAEKSITVKDGGPPNAILHFVPRFSLLPKGLWLRWQTVP